MPKKKNASSLISELKRKTIRNYSSEEKIRIVIEGSLAILLGFLLQLFKTKRHIQQL